ncbi:hypothetical protein HFO42_30820 [Rhizobium leguminosarum]|uniref:Uncharacterized protein n=1 Tax=Rhizobium leguminosarum TaxID=384 RepID=A0AAJ1AEQ1_RHILE|nr:hypothetical protein [Rhizobium leguminosarum]MBY5537938.1 hypothetical protein [Rhizobium leguminosarum]MBY5598810.1 hypothetical protein [Rhizobium leguminosarum]MBY5618951.1 hypothetical protein [Rhizobium leguminosarum]MBY5632433.1 hypothetical protein [Rhizobium leguminosarum]MBY5734388.1 hypothetical protein [Rhizobium leguminosarum]
MSVKSFGQRQAGPVLGWWSVREGEERLVRSDGASVRFLGFVNPDDERGRESSTDRRWMRFEAAVANRSIELFVQQRDVFNPSGSRLLIWRLDYAFSVQQLGIGALDYGEWIEIDRLICDALVCWPQWEATGLRPALIAVNGGWHKGQWRKECYRTFSTAYLDALGHNAVLRSPAFSEGPTRRWYFLPPVRQATVDEEIATRERLAAAKPEEVENLVFRLLPHRPHLESGDRVFVPLSQISGRMIWLYMDDDIITDRISVYAKEAGWTFQIGNEVLVGTIDRRSGTAFKFDFPLEGVKSSVKREFGSFPLVFRDRFRDLCDNAVWQWKEARFYLCDRSSMKNAVKEICIQPPKRIRADHMVSAAGTAVSVRLVTAEETREGKGYDGEMISYIFNDDPTLLNRSIWEQFEYQADASSLTDRTTGQKIELREIVSGSGKTTDECRGVFRYCDSDGEYLLVVTRESRKTSSGAGQWVLDHEASRSKNRQSGRQSIPDVRWHEIANFSRDALLAWPETEIFGPSPSTLLEIGGCFQGRWEPQLRRRQYAHLRTVQSDPSVGRDRVEASALQPWNAIDPDVNVESTGSRVEAILRKLSARRTETAKINQTRRAGWVRADGRAIFYLQDWQTLRTPPDGDAYQAPIFEYLDDDITLRLYPNRFDEYEMESLALMEVNPASVFYGEVEPRPAFSPIWHSQPPRRPTREIWCRLVTAMEAQIERISGQLRIKGLYTAHGYDSAASRTVWLERS